MPEPSQKTEWRAFINAWRGWYSEAMKKGADPYTAAENLARYEYGKEHVKKFRDVSEMPHTGSLSLTKYRETAAPAYGEWEVDAVAV